MNPENNYSGAIGSIVGGLVGVSMAPKGAGWIYGFAGLTAGSIIDSLTGLTSNVYSALAEAGTMPGAKAADNDAAAAPAPAP